MSCWRGLCMILKVWSPWLRNHARGTINSTTGNVTDIGLLQTGNWQKYNGSVNTFALANEMKARDTNGSASRGVVDPWPSGSPGYSNAGGG